MCSLRRCALLEIAGPAVKHDMAFSSTSPLNILDSTLPLPAPVRANIHDPSSKRGVGRKEGRGKAKGASPAANCVPLSVIIY